LLARLFARPANLLVLDEPTNDLDIESLELLETTLQDYPGTLLLVSHDRAFLDNVVTQVIAAEGGGRWREFAGGFSDWLKWRDSRAGRGVGESNEATSGSASTSGPANANKTSASGAASAATAVAAKPKVKMSFKEQRQLELLPGEIEALEAEQQALVARMAEPNWHKAGPEKMRADQQRLEQIAVDMTQKFARWEELEAKRLGG